MKIFRTTLTIEEFDDTSAISGFQMVHQTIGTNKGFKGVIFDIITAKVRAEKFIKEQIPLEGE